MQALCIAFTFLSSLFFLSVLSIECNKTQYLWPVETPKFCCIMCPPGKRMVRRSEKTCEIECTPCTENRYSDSYNVKMSCSICTNCSKSNMDFVSGCNTTHNAVCKCKTGYRCKDQPCTQCELIPATTKSTLPPSCTTSAADILTTLQGSSKLSRDTVWFLVIVALLCAGIALVVATKIKPFLRWIRSKHGYFLTEKPASVPQCVDEEVSKPVQEVCGKCDQPIDV